MAGIKNEWEDLKGLGCVKSTVSEKGETREFTRYPDSAKLKMMQRV